MNTNNSNGTAIERIWTVPNWADVERSDTTSSITRDGNPFATWVSANITGDETTAAYIVRDDEYVNGSVIQGKVMLRVCIADNESVEVPSVVSALDAASAFRLASERFAQILADPPPTIEIVDRKVSTIETDLFHVFTMSGHLGMQCVPKHSWDHLDTEAARNPQPGDTWYNDVFENGDRSSQSTYVGLYRLVGGRSDCSALSTFELVQA
ncbi:hypothetical protein ACL9RL_07120 [Plantibacter sp. Mn2098]|uniref:hypothetical protein n=1 Tax=Plantibacter sp. Mn2098 TaxID=3395266 RepID=UPI003BD1DE2D